MNQRSKIRDLVHPLQSFLGYQLRRASSFMQADLAERIADLGLTVVEASTLLVIEANPGVTQSAIGRLISIKRANMAPLAASLIERGLISAAPVDGRSQGLTLTEEGERTVDLLRQRIAKNEARLIRNLDVSEVERLVEQLNQIWREH